MLQFFYTIYLIKGNNMITGNKKLQLSFNSPVILGFTIACVVVLILDKVTGTVSTNMLFSVYRSSLLSHSDHGIGDGNYQFCIFSAYTASGRKRGCFCTYSVIFFYKF